MSKIENKRREFYREIRMNFLEQYFNKIRSQKLRILQDVEQQEISSIEAFINKFPKGIQSVSRFHISGAVLSRLIESRDMWLQKDNIWLNVCEWSGFVQLIIQILHNVDDKDLRIQIFERATVKICCNFKKRLSQNKLIKRHILSMAIDLTLEAIGEVVMIDGLYLQVINVVLNEILALSYSQYENQMIKIFAVCNQLAKNNQYPVQMMMEDIFIKQRWTIFKVVTFVQEYGFTPKSQKTCVLLQIILIFLINLTQKARNQKFYQIFLRNQFLLVVRNIFDFPNDFLPEVLQLYLKLFFNLVIQNKQFAIFLHKSINFNQILEKIQCEKTFMLIEDIHVLLDQISYQKY